MDDNKEPGFNSPWKAKKQVCLSLIRSKLEFSSVLWNPHVKKPIEDLERVQQRGTNFKVRNPREPNNNHKDYKTRLLEVNLFPLIGMM